MTYRALVCQPCGVAYNPQNMQGHLQGKAHDHQRIRIDVDQFNAAVAACNILPALRRPPSGAIIHPLLGLRVQQGFQCELCSVCMGAKATMIKHQQQLHGKQPMHKVSYAPCSVQKFNNRHETTYFRVFPIPTDPVEEDAFRDAACETIKQSSRLTPRPADDVRNVNIWLRRSKWHEKTAADDPAEVRAWVAEPSDADYPFLGSIIDKWVTQAYEKRETTHVVILKILNSENSPEE